MRNLLTMFFVLAIVTASAQNLVDSQSWTISSGTIGIFQANGGTSENVRETGTDPYGNQSILWKAVPNGGNDADGGWNTAAFAIDRTKMYRFSVWIKKTISTSGTTYFGCQGNQVADLAGTTHSNPYFWNGDLPELNKWYLLVGYVHASTDPSTVSYGGIYDGVTGAKVISMTDFKFTSTATTGIHRAYLYYDTNTSDRQYFFRPEVYQCFDNTPSAEIASNFQVSGNALFGKRVGIGTSPAPDAALSVRGQIHAQEVKVDLNGSVAPDYVFNKDYKLPSIEEIKSYIEKNNHLPEVPSAKEMEASGLNLGEMNLLLLKKVEELTLYVIELKVENVAMKEEIKTIKDNQK